MCSSDILTKYLDKVGEMYDRNYSPEEISSHLGISVSEVNTIISFYTL